MLTIWYKVIFQISRFKTEILFQWFYIAKIFQERILDIAANILPGAPIKGASVLANIKLKIFIFQISNCFYLKDESIT